MLGGIKYWRETYGGEENEAPTTFSDFLDDMKEGGAHEFPIHIRRGDNASTADDRLFDIFGVHQFENRQEEENLNIVDLVEKDEAADLNIADFVEK